VSIVVVEEDLFDVVLAELVEAVANPVVAVGQLGVVVTRVVPALNPNVVISIVLVATGVVLVNPRRYNGTTDIYRTRQ
jgi:hypothetical protein